MIRYQITFLPGELSVSVAAGTSILDAEIAAGLQPDAPCGGRGTCGKCIVSVELENGTLQEVQACQTNIQRNLRVHLPSASGHARILTTGKYTGASFQPEIRVVPISLPARSLADLRSDWDRVKDAVFAASGIPQDALLPNFPLAGYVSKHWKSLQSGAYAVLFRNSVLDIRTDRCCIGAAVDIGTTTVVLYLLDLLTGETLAVKSTLNPQTQFGADVIQRANYAIEHGTEPLRAAICNSINQLLRDACADAQIGCDSVYLMSLVGNTCMHHLFLGFAPDALVQAPYCPAIREALLLTPVDCRLAMNPMGRVLLLPVIAGFVGADTVAVMTACGLDSEKRPTLTVDIGTNGELVLSDGLRIAACSTAAGPALEGAKISRGMRGVPGAVDHVYLDDSGISFSVIGGDAPMGFCGSGLIDLLAVLLDAGLLDETGRFVDEDELPDSRACALYQNMIEIDGQRAYRLAFSADGSPVALTQRDVREVQLAKGAIAAGIRLMAKHLNLPLEKIQQVQIAGAFGNYMSPVSACRIGMIPMCLHDRIVAVGNAAGEGAKLALLDLAQMPKAKTLASKTEFVELATDPDFQDCFVDELGFPEVSL